MTDFPAQDLYQIGSVTALTGIAAERLRAWERRYGFAPAERKGKIRLYSHTQVQNLLKIKRLLDRGESISRIIELSSTQLEARLNVEPAQDLNTVGANRLGRAANVALVGAGILQLEQQSKVADSVSVVGRWANVEALLADAQVPSVDIIALQLPVLLPQLIAQVKDLAPTARVLPIYQFATAEQVRQCEETELNPIRWPLPWRDIEQQCLSLFGVPNLYGVSAPRLFSDEELIAVAVADDSPHQANQKIVEQIHQLNALNSFLNVCSDDALTQSTSTQAQALQQAASDIGQGRAQAEIALQTLLQQQQHDPVSGANPLQTNPSDYPQGGAGNPQH
ncbi:MAG: MerR family transcriptional regulator [Pseudomonadota bacterium]|nr:MerR family transcriptional regulator [Pseudomonadota bacterium]